MREFVTAQPSFVAGNQRQGSRFLRGKVPRM
ncbi:hypothetical protein X742_23255 [Mesorhizobium sp. LNHC232B00]|nr:hypothetical protein X742_23255 [Mesorhizobium sp. LNHC232B00]